MDVYLISFDLKPGVRDVDFTDALAAFLDGMKANARIEGWRLLRRKLGLGPHGSGEFLVMIETRDLAQLDEAFGAAAARAGDVEARHFDVNRHAVNVTFSLMRDFPDPVRVRGEEKF
jgi:hypothetical protein